MWERDVSLLMGLGPIPAAIRLRRALAPASAPARSAPEHSSATEECRPARTAPIRRSGDTRRRQRRLLGKHMTGVLRPRPPSTHDRSPRQSSQHSGRIGHICPTFTPTPRCGFLRFRYGTLSPSARQSGWIRFLFTLRPSHATRRAHRATRHQGGHACKNRILTTPQPDTQTFTRTGSYTTRRGTAVRVPYRRLEVNTRSRSSRLSTLVLTLPRRPPPHDR